MTRLLARTLTFKGAIMTQLEVSALKCPYLNLYSQCNATKRRCLWLVIKVMMNASSSLPSKHTVKIRPSMNQSTNHHETTS